MKNKLKTLVATTLVFAVTATPVLAQDITLKLNGNVLSPAVAPVIENGSTLVPLRIISENMGASVQWNGEERSVTIEKEDTSIYLVLDQKDVIVNGEAKELAVAPKIIDSTTMVPIRFVSENLDCAVNWDGANRVVSIIESGVTVVEPTEKPAVNVAPNEQVPQAPAQKEPVYTADGKHKVIDDENFTVYVTKTGTKYHVDGCSSLSKSKIQTTLGQATDKYFDACDKCEAPILNI